MGHLRMTPAFMFALLEKKVFLLLLFFVFVFFFLFQICCQHQYQSLTKDVSCSLEMSCPDDTGRESWGLVGPPAGERARFNSPEWGGPLGHHRVCAREFRK